MIRPTRIQVAAAYLRTGSLPPLSLVTYPLRVWWLEARLSLAAWLVEGVRRDGSTLITKP